MHGHRVVLAGWASSRPPGRPAAGTRSSAVRGRAFTLVELLIVIAIISMLVTILAPSLARAKEYVHLTLCRNNHSVLTRGTLMYAEEWNGQLPFSNWQSQEDQRGSYKGPGWLYKWPDRTRLKHLQVGQIWQYTSSHKAYRCPVDKPPYEQYTHAITSYMMNGAVTGYGAQMPPWRTQDMPPNGIIYWEVGQGSWNDGSSSPSEDITRRHKDGAVVSCFGGAAVWWTFEEYYDEEARRPGRLWCNPGAPDGARSY
jgi:prepilin-type N-terminal cleavage/methylation domain-containing protein